MAGSVASTNSRNAVRRRRGALIDFFGGLGALLGFLVGMQDVVADSTAAACKTVTGDTIAECITGSIVAGLLPLGVTVAALAMAGVSVGVLLGRAFRVPRGA